MHKRADKPVFVTQPALPPLNEFVEYLEKIWESKWLTNNGQFHKQFETKLADFLGVKYVSLFANGTLALITALQTLKITGEVITTPYSFVATSNSLLWNSIKPVFVDVDPVYGNLDPNKIETAITSQTTAIMPVHVYGNPCEVEHIQEIADKHDLKVIYDAAHTFKNKYKGTSILNFGDLSTLSFHATKSFNTMEGGAIICHDHHTKQRIDYLKNFGFASETSVTAPGINSKMNEMQAAFGLLQLNHYDEYILKREKIADTYRRYLKNVTGIRLMMENEWTTDHNHPYFPIFIDEGYAMTRDELYKHLKENNIFSRRYFYPLISEFSIYRELDSARPENLKNAKFLADKVICLPIFSDLDVKDAVRICKIINR